MISWDVAVITQISFSQRPEERTEITYEMYRAAARIRIKVFANTHEGDETEKNLLTLIHQIS